MVRSSALHSRSKLTFLDNRQSMLFSATQTTKVTDLARMSLRPGPLYINVDERKAASTVDMLEQGYVVCESDKRFLLLFSFLKRNLKKKVIVFFSSCNSVKYHAELLNYIDVPVLDLHVCPFFYLVPLYGIKADEIRENKNNKNVQIHSLNSSMPLLEFCSAQTLQLVVLIFPKSIGLFNSILQMIHVIIFIELEEQQEQVKKGKVYYSYYLPSWDF